MELGQRTTDRAREHDGHTDVTGVRSVTPTPIVPVVGCRPADG